MQSSSFRRANAAPSSSLPTGSRLSSTNGSILTSTGVASLDELFGGGLQLGSLILLKEDRCTTYAKVLLKYFIAQGMVLKHGVFVASSSPAETSEMVVKDLMGVVEGKIEDSDDGDSSNLPGSGSGRLLGQTRRGEDAGDRMKIAWRYQNLPQFSSGLGGANPLRPGMPPSASSPSSPSAPSSPYCHVYDLTKKMSPELIQSNIENMTCLNLDAQDPYQKLFTDIKKKIHQGGYHAGKVSSGRPLNILRIAIPSIGSGFWGSEEYNATALPKFLFALRGLLRSSLAVCVVTIPAYIYNDIYGVCTSPFIRACEHIADGVLEVESFAGSQKHVHEAFTQDYHGLIHPHKLPLINALAPLTRQSSHQLRNLAFKVRRKRFLIETFHLPPEMEDTPARTSGKSSTQTDPLQGKKKVGCGSGNEKKEEW